MNKGIKNYLAPVFIACIVMLSGYFIYNKLYAKTLAPNLISGSGRIDGDLILLNTKYSARVDNIYLKEGDKVKKREVVAKLNSDELLEKQKSLLAGIDAKKLEIQLLKKILPKTVSLKEALLLTTQHKFSEIIISLEKLSLTLEQSKKDFIRNKKLHKTKAITDEQFEHIELKYNTLQKEYEVLEIKKQTVKNSINMAKIDLQIAKDKLVKIDIAKKSFKVLQANLKELQVMIDELSIRSPVDGYVIEKIANIGEVIGAGAGVLTISNTSSYYLKLFVDTLENGKIKIGDDAVIFLDAYPNKPIKAKVIQIAQRAEFTPKEVSVRSDRIQRVYAVHLRPLEENPLLKLGIPAIGIISLDKKELPHSLDEIPEI